MVPEIHRIYIMFVLYFKSIFLDYFVILMSKII